VFNRCGTLTHISAVGTLLPTAIDGLRAFLAAAARVASANPELRERVRIWFVGTSNERRADAPAVVRPLAEAAGVGDFVKEHAPRLGYFDALHVLRDAHAVLVLGSGEPHYTPSRVFPALASRRPVIARLHRESPAWHLLRSAASSRKVELITWSADVDQQTEAFADALRRVALCPRAADAVDDAPLTAFTGEALARQVAAMLDEVCGR
jgi:hypothetical protein